MEREHVPPVDVETVLRLLAPDASGVPVRCRLRYDAADPYAVQVCFHLEARAVEPVSWSFARDLLAAGLDGPSGLGDVRVWPWRTTHGESVAMALTSPDGQALLEAPRATLVAFLADTYALVPPGGESERLDIDADAWLSGQLLPDKTEEDDQEGR